MSRSSALAPWLLPVVALGCGGDDAPTPGPSAETSVAELCAQLAEADCARLDACGYLTMTFPRAACVARQRDVLCAPVARVLARAELADEGTWLSAAGRRCVEALGAPDCERGFDYDPFDVPACRAAYLPRAAMGEPCSFIASCVEGTFCDARSACPGTCRPLAGPNESCGAANPCRPGTYCALPAMRCLAASSLGASCDVLALGSSCREGSFCDATQAGGPRCVPGRGRGFGCQDDAQCAAGLRCIRNLCSAGQANDTCQASADCRGAARCHAGRCAVPGGDGAPCTASTACDRGLACGPGGCASGAASGEACDERPCAPGGRCLAGVCVALALDGEPCGAPTDCLDGRSCIEGACRAVGAFCPI